MRELGGALCGMPGVVGREKEGGSAPGASGGSKRLSRGQLLIEGEGGGGGRIEVGVGARCSPAPTLELESAIARDAGCRK